MRYLMFKICLITLFTTSAAMAGNLIIHNGSDQLYVCKTDSMAISIGPNTDFAITPEPNQTIDTVSCNGLKVQSLEVSTDSTDAFIVLNGRQTRSLNTTLYPNLPTVPGTSFSNALLQIINGFQDENPHVLLNLRLDHSIDIYDNDSLKSHLGKGGFDVMELDMLYLGFLVESDLINSLTDYDTSNIFPKALDIATLEGQLWALPTWLCTDFIFSYDDFIHRITTAQGLNDFLKTQPSDQVHYAGKLIGTWEMPSFYISSYWQTYPSRTMEQALQMPPDPTVINNMYLLTESCNFQDENNCINGVYTGNAPQRDFADGVASSTSGYAESSFYIELFEPHSKPLFAQPLPWGNTMRPLLYADAFVTSKANCSANPCASDARSFLAYMSTDKVKNMFSFSEDLMPGMPWRRLLPATESFYKQIAVITDPLYPQFESVLTQGDAYPTTISGPIQMNIYNQVCAALKAKDNRYICDSDAPSNRGLVTRPDKGK